MTLRYSAGGVGLLRDKNRKVCCGLLCSSSADQRSSVKWGWPAYTASTVCDICTFAVICSITGISLMGHMAHIICRLYFHFWVAVCLFFRSSTHAKHFIWKWLDFHENEWTGDIHLVLHKDSCHRGKSQLGIGLFIHELPQGAFDQRVLSFFGILPVL